MGTDSLRFYLINNMTSSGDSPISMSLLKQGYKQLANNIGNRQMRVLKMIEKNLDSIIPEVQIQKDDLNLLEEISSSFSQVYKEDNCFLFIKV